MSCCQVFTGKYLISKSFLQVFLMVYVPNNTRNNRLLWHTSWMTCGKCTNLQNQECNFLHRITWLFCFVLDDSLSTVFFSNYFAMQFIFTYGKCNIRSLWKTHKKYTPGENAYMNTFFCRFLRYLTKVFSDLMEDC